VEAGVSRPGQLDESKIIDLRQLGALVDTGSAPSGAAAESALALPTFGPDRLNPARPLHAPTFSADSRLISAPIATVPVALPNSAPGTTILMAAVCVLTTVVVGLAYYVIISDPGQTIVREPVLAVAPAVAEKDEPKRQRDTPTDAAAVLSHSEGEADQPDADPDAKPEDKRLAASAKAPRRTGRNRRGQPKRTQAPLAAPSEPRKTAPRNSKHASDVPAECVIDPASCGLGTGRDNRPPPPKPAVDLPEKLGESALRKGMAKVKSKAKACRSRYGGSAGEKVQVKLTISGGTGRITKAAPIGPHAGTPLGGCVAAALKRAEFPRFGASVQGVRYGVRL